MKKLIIPLAVAALTLVGIADAAQAANKVTLALRISQSSAACSLVAWVGDSNGTPSPNRSVELWTQNNILVGNATSGANGQANFLLRRSGNLLTLIAVVQGFGQSYEYPQCSPGRRVN
jgi:hypothetical protein